jgi:hypothetical protein
MKRYVLSASGGNVKVVFLSSCHSRMQQGGCLSQSGRACHTLCVASESQSVFRDPTMAPLHLPRPFIYQALTKNKTLKEAFHMTWGWTTVCPMTIPPGQECAKHRGTLSASPMPTTPHPTTLAAVVGYYIYIYMCVLFSSRLQQ